MKKRALGKGLEALFTNDYHEDRHDDLPLNRIEPNPGQPRKSFDNEQLSTLAESIKRHGVLQPIVVTKREDGLYTIVAGERRWRAARIAGLKSIPAVIKEFSEPESFELALVENLQREDLNPIDEARGYKQLIELFSLTQDEVSERVGKSRPAVANSLRLLNLPWEICDMLSAGLLSGGHARALLSIDNPNKQVELAKKIVSLGLNVRQAEAEAKAAMNPPKKVAQRQKSAHGHFAEFESRLSEILSTKVRIGGGNKKGKIEIEYYDEEQLGRLLSYLIRP